jgi:hypothetical protein
VRGIRGGLRGAGNIRRHLAAQVLAELLFASLTAMASEYVTSVHSIRRSRFPCQALTTATTQTLTKSSGEAAASDLLLLLFQSQLCSTILAAEPLTLSTASGNWWLSGTLPMTFSDGF